MDFYFVGGFIGLMGLAVIWFWKIRHQQVNAIASIVTVIGVLGTFSGIAWGLLHFDPIDIKASVPKLLEGLKVAFITSIVGILGSIFLKWATLNKQRKQSASVETYTGATVDDLAELLRDILTIEKQEGNETKEALKSIEETFTEKANDLAELLRDILTVEKEEGRETKEALKSIEKSLTGEGDSTVLTQLQKLRTTFSDKQDDLIQAFGEFAQEMAENNTKALMEALENVIKDFNQKITEQFGDNFKHLNQAVGRINDWQEQYRQQMDELAQEFRIAAESVEKSSQSLAAIADRSDAIVSSAEKLDPILIALQQQIGQIDTHLKAFSTIAENARDAFPIVEKRLDELTNGFTHVVKESIDNSYASMEKQRDALANQSKQLEQTVEDTGVRFQQQTEALFNSTTARVEQIINDTFQGFKSALENQVKQLETTIVETNRGLADTLQTQSKQLETTVENTSTQIKTITDGFSTVVQDSLANSQLDMQRQREALGEITRQVETVIQNTSEKLGKTLEETNSKLEETLQTQSRQLNTISNESERVFRESAERMNQQVRFIDEALQEELTKSLQSLGSQLTSLSNRFVQDYTPLTNRLKDVLDIARSLQGRTN